MMESRRYWATPSSIIRRLVSFWLSGLLNFDAQGTGGFVRPLRESPEKSMPTHHSRFHPASATRQFNLGTPSPPSGLGEGGGGGSGNNGRHKFLKREWSSRICSSGIF